MPLITSVPPSSRRQLVLSLADASSESLKNIDPNLLFEASSRLHAISSQTSLESGTADTRCKMQACADNNRMAHALSLSNGCVRLFVAGAKSHVGKTTICLGILGALRHAGIPASQLAYIKPATQCEEPDLLAYWCKTEGVTYVANTSAPLIFFKGFTRSFLDGEQSSSREIFSRIEDAVTQLCVGRRFVLIDGVGFPAVGSVVGVSNADVATAARAPVCIVAASGVGSAIDSFALNTGFFSFHRVPVIGGIFNRAKADGFYSAAQCGAYIQKWFRQSPLATRCKYFGIVPTAPELDGLRKRVSAAAVDAAAMDALACRNIAHVRANVNVAGIIAAAASDPWNQTCSGGSSRKSALCRSAASASAPAALKAAGGTAVGGAIRRSREDVIAAAAAAGAKKSA